MQTCSRTGTGVLALLLLNGQHFTNTLIFLGCVVISGLLWTRFYFSSKNDTQQSGRVAVLFHVVIIFAGAVTLPKCYHAQMKFNNMANSAKNRAAITAED